MRNAMWVGGGITGMGEIPMLGVKEKGIAKVIRDIFRNGEKGFFYDPSDLKTQYQDSVGTTAVNASGQPLGLMLDKSKGLTLGSELFIESKVTLTYQSTKISAGYYNISSTADTSAVQTNSASGTKWRVVEYEITRIGSGSIRLDYTSGGNIVLPPTLGRRKVYIYGDRVNFVRNTMPTDIDFKIYSIKELAGNHAYQTTSAARPIFRQKPILGSELVVNGDFSNGTTGWSYSGCTFTVEDGIAKILATGGGMSARIQRTFTTEVGKQYRLSLFTRKPSGGGTSVGAWVAGASTIYSKSSQGVIQDVIFTATMPSYTVNVDMGSTVAAGEVAYIDNVSVKELIGYRTDQNYIEYDGVDDKLITNLPAQLTGCTVIRSVPNVGTQILTNQTIPATYEDNKDHCGLIVINRALTPSETSAIAAEFNKRAGV